MPTSTSQTYGEGTEILAVSVCDFAIQPFLACDNICLRARGNDY